MSVAQHGWRREPPRAVGLWRGPLVSVALLFIAGILLDRHWHLSLPGSLFALIVMLAAWTMTGLSRAAGWPLVYLGLAVVAFGAAYHHYRRDTAAKDDIGRMAEAMPGPVQVRGILDEEPVSNTHRRNDPLYQPRRGQTLPSTRAILRVGQDQSKGGWSNASGCLQMFISGPLDGLHAGDAIEAVGRLETLPVPENPGERDWSSALRDEGVRAVLRIQYTPEAVTRLDTASVFSLPAVLARLRGWGNRTLHELLPSSHADLAAALLLGENQALASDDWDRYIRTGVIHVLVVSGQHLVILASFLWFWLRFMPMRRKRAVLVVLLVLWVYALLAGGRPSVVRAAATVSVFAGGYLLRRLTIPANALAGAWILILLLNPTDVNNTGCLLSFACVAALYWDTHRRRLNAVAIDPLDRLLAQSRPAWQRWLLALGRLVGAAYAISALLWLVATPLAASRLHFVPLAGLLIGPPVVLLTSLALVSGFLTLLAALLVLPLASLCAWATDGLLRGCNALVALGDGVWARQGYVADIPAWWLIGFYLILTLAAFLPRFARKGVSLLGLGTVWGLAGFLALTLRPSSDELRVTFLAVGHGGCTVLETPDGRTILYDAGSIAGPGITRRVIAPYLWQRGIRRIDEVILSHADLDHFSGLRDLLDRFSVKQITCTPTFREKDNAAIHHLLTAIERSGVPVRIVVRGDRLSAGSVTMEVLHPPERGPEGIENLRSLVLLVRHGRHSFLLTGDLEGEGLKQLLEQPARRVDVLMAPHHGSQRMHDAERLLAWGHPQLILSCQGQRELSLTGDPYRRARSRFRGTWPHGAITIRSHTSGLVVETFVTRERFVLRSNEE